MREKLTKQCPECGTRGYLVWPSYGNCQTCLRLRHEFLNQVFGVASVDSDTPEPAEHSEAERETDHGSIHLNAIVGAGAIPALPLLRS